MASDLGLSTGLTGIPAIPQSSHMLETRVGAFQRALSAAPAAPGPAQPAPLGTATVSVAAAIRDLERQAGTLKPGASGQLPKGPRTSGLGGEDLEAGHDRMVEHLVVAAQQNLKLVVWSQVIGNTVAKPAEVFSKLTQG